MEMSQMPVNQPKFSVAIGTKTYQKLINNTLGDPERAKRFIASISSAVSVNPVLQECEAGTILAGALLGESLNLSPSPQLGQYHLVPFEVAVKGPDGKTVWLLDDKGEPVKDANGKRVALTVKKAQFMLGYKGYIQLALRSGAYADLDVMEIREGEYKGKSRATGKPMFEFVEDDDERDKLPVIGYMAYLEYLNGSTKVIYWSRAKMVNHADTYSKAYSAAAHKKIMAGEIADKDMWKYSSNWYKDFDGMAKKTMLRQLISKWGIMSTETAEAVSRDGGFAEINENGEIVNSDKSNMELSLPEPIPVKQTVDLNSL